MRKVKMYLLLWEPGEPENNGQPGTRFEKVPTGYVSQVEAFLGGVAGESGHLGSVYSVDSLYGETSGLGGGEYNAEFGGLLTDRERYPARNTTTCPVATEEEEKKGFGLPPKEEPCISDAKGSLQLPQNILHVIEAYDARNPTTPLADGMEAIYFVLMPHDVNSCSGFEGTEAACNTNYYCAYHSAFTYESEKHTVVYANMPYDDVPGCETPDQPNGNPADDEINTLSHEGNEAVTDPLGGGWYDYEGEEVADKCTNPFFDPAIDFNAEIDAYGGLLGGTRAEYKEVESEGERYLERTKIGTAYNQEINGGHYLLQREWSNAAGGCVTRAPSVRAAFSYEPSPPLENVRVDFTGTPSRTEAGQIVSYEWEFGDPGSGSANTSSEVDPTHIYAAAGAYDVRLTVTNDSGVTESTTRELVVGKESEARVVTSTSTTSLTTTRTETSSVTETMTTSFTTSIPVLSLSSTTTTVTTQAPEQPVARRSSDEIAKLIGLPRNRERLGGLGSIALGHAECPPACSIAARVRTTVGSGRHRKQIWIGSSHLRLEAKRFGDLSIRLNGKGRKLLSRQGHLNVQLVVVVTGREGAAWRASRSLTLTSAGKAASERHPGRHGHAARRRA